MSNIKAYLVIVQIGKKPRHYLDESLEEITELARSCEREVVGFSKAVLPEPSPSHLIRKGKMEEVRTAAKAAGAKFLIFNVDLSPGQARNIETDCKITPVDRTGLILDIFAKRAQSREGKLQVELARLNYILPRLMGLGLKMSRLGGGIGTRGPGEQELEWDRRKIRKRIARVKDELEKVEKHRALIRLSRKKKHFTTVALVGYTNAGKSTLMNALTGAGAYVEDKLFATLDPMTRLQSVNGQSNILFIDTVGLIKDLPHGLVKAFHATLEEVTEADMLIHVLDAASPHAEQQKAAVDEVLQEINAAEKISVLVLNKADLLSDDEKRRAEGIWAHGMLISAKSSLGMNGLIVKLEGIIQDLRTASNHSPLADFGHSSS